MQISRWFNVICILQRLNQSKIHSDINSLSNIVCTKFFKNCFSIYLNRVKRTMNQVCNFIHGITHSRIFKNIKFNIF